jgi:CRP-like cAMP-binding protein
MLAHLTHESSGLLLTDNPRLLPRPRALLDGLSTEEKASVEARGHRTEVEAGAYVFSQGSRHDGIFLIETGQVRVFYTAPSDRQITLAYWNPGNFVGGPQVFGNGGIHAWSGVATRDSTIFVLPARALRELVTTIPALAVGIIEGLAFKGECYSALAQMLGTRSVSQRLVQLIVRLGEIYGVQEESKLRIASDFNHADLANIVGATRQWVTTMLGRMQEKGAVEVRAGQLYILDLARLHAIARDS